MVNDKEKSDTGEWHGSLRAKRPKYVCVNCGDPMKTMEVRCEDCDRPVHRHCSGSEKKCFECGEQ